MLDPARWDRLRGLALAPRAMAAGSWPGGHAATRAGTGSEFHDYRPYTPGDDVSQLDWKVFGRSDRYYLRRHRRETDLTLHVLVDASASMDFAGLDAAGRPIASDPDRAPTKLRYALDLAAALTVIAVQQGDRAGAGVYDGELRAYLEPGGTWPHVHRVCEVLGGAMPARPGVVADPAAAIEHMHRRWPGRSMVVLVSDFLDELEGPADVFTAIDRLRHAGSDVAAMCVLTPTELDPAQLTRPLRLIEPETRAAVSTHPPAIVDRYRRRLHAHLDTFRTACRARRAGCHLLRTDEPVPAALRRVLPARH